MTVRRILLLLLISLAAGAMLLPACSAGGEGGRYVIHCNVDGAIVMMDDQVAGVIENGTLAVPVNASSPRYHTFSVTSPRSTRTMIWVKEGSDLMYSSYGVSPEMATNVIPFDGKLPSSGIDSAELFLVAPSGGYSRDLTIDINKLMVNRLDEQKTPPLIRTIFSIVFPNYKGKEWSDIFSLDNTTQIGFETKEIKPYLKTENNVVSVRDQGDYMQLTNAILSITYTGENP